MEKARGGIRFEKAEKLKRGSGKTSLRNGKRGGDAKKVETVYRGKKWAAAG